MAPFLISSTFSGAAVVRGETRIRGAFICDAVLIRGKMVSTGLIF